ncbi:MAG TPA: response regulator [Kofleriaceae bacterium]
MTPARILIVEDDRIVARDIAQQLERLGYTVIATVARGDETIELARSTRPSLVLMDIRLEGPLDGVEAATQIKTLAPVVFLTAYADDHTIARATEAQPYGYLVKPFDDSQLRTTIELALHKHAADLRLEAEALRAANARIQLALQGSEIGVWEFEMPDGILENASIRLFNYGDHDDQRVTWADAVAGWHPEDRDNVIAAIRAYLAGETDHYEAEARFLQRAGDYRSRIARGVAIRDATGRPTRFIGSSVDITDRLDIAEALRVSEERYRNTFETAPVGFVHTDFVNHAVLRVNETFCQITGYSRAELLGTAGMEIIHPDDQQATRDRFALLASGELTAYTSRFRIYRKDGGLIWVRVSVSLGRDRPGSAPYAVAIIEDISDSQRLEHALQLAKEAAESSNRAKDEFLANVSHEIRTPMNAILGMTELVLDTELSDAQRQSLRTVKSAASGLLVIINDLLDFSKIEAGKLELDPTPFRLRGLFGDTMRALAMRAHRKGLELLCNIATDVPDVLIGDAGRLRQVLINLVGNAIKFTNHGEVQVDVTADVRATDATLHVGVRDTGIGISADKRETIFRAFEQADMSTTRRYGGTGLGLTIASRLVALMDGAIHVDSTPNVGSTFTFDARFAWQPSASDAESARSYERLSDQRVLVVDDNAANREILVRWLSSWKMRVHAVSDGLAAMDALWHGVSTRDPYALVILDARMPDTDGLAIAAKIRDREELMDTRILLLTSGDRHGDLERIKELQIDAHVLKPVPEDELFETVLGVMTRVTTPSHLGAVVDAEREVAMPLRVLVAEDNSFNARLLRQLLVSRGHAVRVASDGREALRQALTGSFDLLLLDLHMPELDGFGVIAALRDAERGTGRHLPVIALTARARAEDRRRCFDAGMDEFLAKPIQAMALWAAIDAHVQRPTLLSGAVLLAACGGDPRILAELREGLAERVPVELEAIESALNAGDARQVRERAHGLAGMLSAFSTGAARAASELEDVAAAENLAGAAALVPRLRAIATEVVRAVADVTIESLGTS